MNFYRPFGSGTENFTAARYCEKAPYTTKALISLHETAPLPKVKSTFCYLTQYMSYREIILMHIIAYFLQAVNRSGVAFAQKNVKKPYFRGLISPIFFFKRAFYIFLKNISSYNPANTFPRHHKKRPQSPHWEALRPFQKCLILYGNSYKPRMEGDLGKHLGVDRCVQAQRLAVVVDGNGRAGRDGALDDLAG